MLRGRPLDVFNGALGEPEFGFLPLSGGLIGLGETVAGVGLEPGRGGLDEVLENGNGFLGLPVFVQLDGRPSHGLEGIDDGRFDVLPPGCVPEPDAVLPLFLCQGFVVGFGGIQQQDGFVVPVFLFRIQRRRVYAGKECPDGGIVTCGNIDGRLFDPAQE